MKPSPGGGTLRTHVEARHFSPRRGEIEAMRDRMAPLRARTRNFPFANLQITISYLLPGEEYHVKARLAVPGRVLLTGEHDAVVMPPYERCVRKLVHKVELDELRRRISRDHSSGGRRDDTSDHSSGDGRERVRLRQAFGRHDCQAFLAEMARYRGTIRKRIREWIQEHVSAAVEVREGLLDDLVDEVMLSAFERYESRPSSLRTGDWITILIDPALRSMLGRPDEPDEAVSYARSLRDMGSKSTPPTADPSGGHGSRTKWSPDRSRGTNRESAGIRKHRQ